MHVTFVRASSFQYYTRDEFSGITRDGTVIKTGSDVNNYRLYTYHVILTNINDTLVIASLLSLKQRNSINRRIDAGISTAHARVELKDDVTCQTGYLGCVVVRPKNMSDRVNQHARR